MHNCVIQVGRLTKEPILRHTTEGTPVTSFTIAVNRDYTNDAGEKKADFLPVVVWKKTAENCCQYLKKGSLVLVDGKLQSRSYQDNNGKNVYVVEIVADSVKFLDPVPSNQRNNNQNNNDSGTNRNQNNKRGNYNESGNHYDPFENDPSDNWPF